MKIPRLADVKCTRIQFQPGDRVIVNVYHHLTIDEKKKLSRTIVKWAGEDVEVLVVDRNYMEVIVDKYQ